MTWHYQQYNLGRNSDKKKRIFGGPIGRAVTGTNNQVDQILEKAEAFDRMMLARNKAEATFAYDTIKEKAEAFDKLVKYGGIPSIQPLTTLPPLPPLAPVSSDTIREMMEHHRDEQEASKKVEPTKVKVVSSTSENKCPYCMDEITPEEDEALRCKYCSALQHFECLQENFNKCTTCSREQTFLIGEVKHTFSTPSSPNRINEEDKKFAGTIAKLAVASVLFPVIGIMFTYKLFVLLPLVLILLFIFVTII